MRWREARLSDVLELAIDVVPVDLAGVYRMAGVFSFGKGLFRRQDLSGSETTYRYLHRLHSGEFVMSQLKAWEGALAVVPEGFDGTFLSPQFPTFRVNGSQLDVRFLWWIFRQPTFWEVLKRESRGMGARRDSVSPATLLRQAVLLPPLDEQRRIATKLEEIERRLVEAKELRNAFFHDLRRLLISMTRRLDLSDQERAASGWRRFMLGDVISERRDVVPVDPDLSYPNLGIYSYARGLFEKEPIDGARTSAKALTRVHRRQFIYSRLFAFEGAYGVVPKEFDGHFVSNEYPTFDCDETYVLPECLGAYFISPGAWADVAAGSKGLGVRRQRVQPRQLLTHSLLIPPMEEQQRIKAVMDRARDVARETAGAERPWSRLMPAILERAFRGEV